MPAGYVPRALLFGWLFPAQALSFLGGNGLFLWTRQNPHTGVVHAIRSLFRPFDGLALTVQAEHKALPPGVFFGIPCHTDGKLSPVQRNEGLTIGHTGTHLLKVQQKLVEGLVFGGFPGRLSDARTSKAVSQIGQQIH